MNKQFNFIFNIKTNVFEAKPENAFYIFVDNCLIYSAYTFSLDTY